MNGILLLDKPIGWTSFDVVKKTKNIVGGKIKVGHAGTLDPLATGLLIILVGKATKQQDHFMKHDKVYEVSGTLGAISSTLDAEGELTENDKPLPSEAELKSAAENYLGDIEQTPPQYSAIKVDGQRAYKMAREGKTVELKKRPVTIHSINNFTYDGQVFSFTVDVSSGTYIRSLIHDIGQDVGCGAYTSQLRRTSIADFSVDKSLPKEQWSEDSFTENIIPLEKVSVS